MANQSRNMPLVDLVIVIDTSPSMKDEAQALSHAATRAITSAKSSCPSDLRVAWLGIEGTWKGTNFDQTIRAYLTQKCKVSESKLRGRKRGELASAGAQEDAARAIEDISDYFDWREGAARAIFYLGDEALEAGGDKTEQKDIVAANVAIQKAQAAKVTVHTYFGTSNSKHQESVKREYARVATETGGKYFTNKDAIAGFSTVLEKVICGSRIREATTQKAQTTTPQSTSATTNQTTPKVVSQATDIQKEKVMTLLTIDTKNNCYVIDSERMNHLQQNVASSLTLEQGSYDIKINSGTYKYAKAKTEGEPFVLLWIYGVDGSTFVNQTTGFETGATWTTLNGYYDTLKLEIKEKAVLCGLFFDVTNSDSSGSIQLLITSDKPYFNPHQLTVNGKKNCYLLDENSLSSLKQSGTNFIELEPGNYSIKIREGNASYWSESQKFKLEPWAIVWVKGGKFITKLAGVEVEESWCSLNGLKDQIVLEVKEKTTLFGLFFDTYKEDNEGQVILAIEPVSATELAEKYKKQENERVKEQRQERTITSETVTNTQSTAGSVSREAVTNIEGAAGGSVSREAVSASGSMNFSFRFNEDELKKKWEEQLQQINASIKVIDEGGVTLEAKYWDQLEQWLLKNYEKHFKNLAVEVAKVRFTMDAYTEQIEFSLNQQLQGWSGYLDRLLQERINVEISKRINQQINQYFDQTFEQKLRNNIGLILNNLVNQQELNQYVNRQIDSSFERKISNNINGITQSLIKDNAELERYVSRQIDSTYEQKLQDRVQVITRNIVNNNEELNQYIDRRLQQTVINNTGINNEIVNLVANSTEINTKIESIYKDIDTKIESVRNEWNQTFISLIRQYVDELIDIIGDTETFNIRIANSIDIKVNELVSQIMRAKNELTAIMNNANRHLYEWTLGELMAIKGCLTDREALVEQVVSFSAQLRTKLDSTPCVDINTFKPFKPNLMEPKQQEQLSPGQPQQLPGS